MTDKEKNLMKASLALLAIAVVFLILRRSYGPGSSFSIEGDNYVTDMSSNGGGEIVGPLGVPITNYFNSDNAINVNTIGINELSRKYIPMFGLVGMTAVGSYQVNVTVPPAEVIEFQTPSFDIEIVNGPQQYQGYIGQYFNKNQNTQGSGRATINKTVDPIQAQKMYQAAVKGQLYANDSRWY